MEDRDAQSGPTHYTNIWVIRWETVVNLVSSGWGTSSSFANPAVLPIHFTLH